MTPILIHEVECLTCGVRGNQLHRFKCELCGEFREGIFLVLQTSELHAHPGGARGDGDEAGGEAMSEEREKALHAWWVRQTWPERITHAHVRDAWREGHGAGLKDRADQVTKLQERVEELERDIGQINNDWHAETMRKLAAEARAAELEATACHFDELRRDVVTKCGLACDRAEAAEARVQELEALIGQLQAGAMKLELDRVKELDRRLAEARQLLRRFVKYVREDCAVTPRATRLARLTEQVDDYLRRTADPRDILRATSTTTEPEPEG